MTPPDSFCACRAVRVYSDMQEDLSADDYRTRQQGGVSELFWQFDLLQAGGSSAPDAKAKTFEGDNLA